METNERVKIARVFAGLSTDQLAKRLGLARTNVIRWESESGLSLPAKQVKRLADATGVPAAFLEGGQMEGLVIARPGRFIAKNTRQRTYSYVERILPDLLKCEHARCISLASGRRYALILHVNKLCLVLIPADERVPLTRDLSHTKTLPVSDEILLDAFESDIAVDKLLHAANITDFTTGNKSTDIRILLNGGDKRPAIDRLLAVVEELRKDGYDVHVAITDKRGDVFD